MRRDIEVHINTGDVVLTQINKIIEYPFQWVNNTNGLQRYIYGEVIIPANISFDSIMKGGICFSIPYTAQYKEFYIRIKRVFDSNNYMYVQNPVNGSEWFLAQVGLYGARNTNVYASQLMLISKGPLLGYIAGGVIMLYSAYRKDFKISPALNQNMNMMLACNPTNNYRFPLTGVGLIKWIKSNIINTNLADVLQREFSGDGTPVISADYDFDTKQLKLKLDTSNVD